MYNQLCKLSYEISFMLLQRTRRSF